MDADGSNPHVLVDRKEYSFSSPRYTPEGDSLIVSGSQTDELTYRQTYLARFDSRTTNSRGSPKNGIPPRAPAR